MHEYMRRIEKALSLGVIDEGSAAHCTVGHDEWCKTHEGRECNCDPEITIKASNGTMSIDKDGILHRVAAGDDRN